MVVNIPKSHHQENILEHSILEVQLLLPFSLRSVYYFDNPLVQQLDDRQFLSRVRSEMCKNPWICLAPSIPFKVNERIPLNSIRTFQIHSLALHTASYLVFYSRHILLQLILKPGLHLYHEQTL